MPPPEDPAATGEATTGAQIRALERPFKDRNTLLDARGRDFLAVFQAALRRQDKQRKAGGKDATPSSLTPWPARPGVPAAAGEATTGAQIRALERPFKDRNALLDARGRDFLAVFQATLRRQDEQRKAGGKDAAPSSLTPWLARPGLPAPDGGLPLGSGPQWPPPLLRVMAREPARAGSRALYEPSRASTTGSRKHRAARPPSLGEPSRARLGSARFQP